MRSAWAAPILGSDGVLGTVSGYAASPGNPASERLELATIYLRYAASAIERERLLTEVSRRNRVLESLRGLLESLAGPERLQGGLEISLLALVDGLGADTVAVMAADGESAECRSVAGPSGPGVLPGLAAGAAAVLSCGPDDGAAAGDVPARLVAPGLAAGSLRLPGQRGALVAWWSPGKTVTEDALELLDDASRSLALAMERESLETARREAAALRRSQSIQRDMLSSLSHELRTPLTAIHGYASTLCQPDLTWNPEATRRFLGSIAAESARMERLVGDLLDSTAIESGVLRLQRDWCDLALVVGAAANCLSSEAVVRVRVTEVVEPVWADHDRLEQVFVNLLENAASHGASPRGTDVTVRPAGCRGGPRWRSPTTGRASRPGWPGRSSSRGSGAPPRWPAPGWGCPSHGGSSKRTAAPWWWRRPIPGRPSWSRSRQIRHRARGEPAGASWSVVEEPEEHRGG